MTPGTDFDKTKFPKNRSCENAPSTTTGAAMSIGECGGGFVLRFPRQPMLPEPLELPLPEWEDRMSNEEVTHNRRINKDLVFIRRG